MGKSPRKKSDADLDADLEAIEAATKAEWADARDLEAIAAAEKAESADERDREPETTEVDDTPVVYVDVATFTRPERDAIQRMFGQEFERLCEHVRDTVYRPATAAGDEAGDGEVRWEAGKPLASFAGEPIFADQVLIEMMKTVRRREDPDADLSEFDELSIGQLRAVQASGRAAAPKG